MKRNFKIRLKKKAPNLYYYISFLKHYIRFIFKPFRLPVSKKLENIYIKNKNLLVNKPSNKNILFFSARQDPDQIIVSTILRWSLKLRGYNTYVIGCDRALINSCNSGSSPKLNTWQCKSCFYFANKTYNSTETDIDWLKSLINTDDIAEAELLLNDLDSLKYKDFTYKGFNIGDFVRVSIAHFLKTNTIDSNSSNEIKIYKNWLKSAIIQVNAFSRFLEHRKPDTIVMLNGLFSAERIMLEVARTKNINVITYEVGFIPQTFFFMKNSPINMCNNTYWSDFSIIELTNEQNIELNSYMANRNNGKGYLINYFPNIISDKDKIEKKFGIDFNKKTFLLFPNITWDSTLYNCDILFDSMIDWIIKTIQFFINKPQVQLIIRVHPAESTLENADRDPVLKFIQLRFPTLASNIIIIPSDSDVSSYILMDNTDCGLVYGSTTGIEMGLRGLPVIVSGKIYYRGLGVSIDPDTKDEYFNILENLCNDSYSFNKSKYTEMWRRYAYFAIFRSALKLPYFDYPSTNKFPSIDLHSIENLRPGVSKELDIICDGITKGTRFIKS
ncbi:MAG: hypothetical protein HQ490_02560 [Lutibacter sp.]|nr:hypothetical protein [Lutibacter sp.]